MRISSVPDSLSGRGGVVELHSHANLLRSLSGEDVGGRRLHDLGGSVDNLLVSLVERLDLDDLESRVHSGVGELDGEFVSGENHTGEVDVVAVKEETRRREERE